MLVRGEVLRGKFRNSFENPEPFLPNQETQVSFEIPDLAHQFDVSVAGRISQWVLQLATATGQRTEDGGQSIDGRYRISPSSKSWCLWVTACLLASAPAAVAVQSETGRSPDAAIGSARKTEAALSSADNEFRPCLAYCTEFAPTRLFSNSTQPKMA